MMEDDTRAGWSRRELLKRTLRVGAYAAPVVLSTTLPAAPIAAATPAPALCTQPVAFLQDAILLGVAPGSAYTVYAQLSNAGAPSAIGTFTADALGVAAGVFPLSLDTSAVTSVTLSVFLTGTAPPAPPAATFVSTLVTALACTAGGGRAASRLLARVVQEPTAAACGSGTLNQWQELVDVNLVNATATTAYDVYIQAYNGLTGFAKAGTLTTNAQGNAGGVLPVTIATAVGAPTAVTVNIVPAGAAPTSATFTAIAAPTGSLITSTLLTVSCAGAVTSFSVANPQLLAVR